MYPLFALIVKEFKQILHSRQTLAVAFGVPILQLFLIGFALCTETKHISIAVVDYDHSATSTELVKAFTLTDRFAFKGYLASDIAAENALKNWQVQTALIIPRHFSRDVVNQHIPTLMLLIDGVDAQTSGQAIGYANSIIRSKINGFVPANMQVMPLNVDDRMHYNPDLNPAPYMIPGIIVVLLVVLSLMLSAMALVREKEHGTFEQLIVSPLSKLQLLLGKILPFLILSLIEFCIALTVGMLAFKFYPVGSFFTMFIGGLVFLFTTLGLGVLVSIISGSQQQAMFFSWFIMMFMILLSGLFLPIANMPPLIQDITYLNPMRYFINIMRDIVLKGSSVYNLRMELIPLMGLGLIIFATAWMGFSKRVK